MLLPSIRFFFKRKWRISESGISDSGSWASAECRILTGNAPNLVDIFHDIFATGLEVGEEGDAVGDGLESVNIELDADGVGNGNQMEDSIGGTSKNHSQNLNACLSGAFDMLEHCMHTMAFSNADLVMISRGRMFFSRRFRITDPMDAHSSCFSLDSAGKDDEPGTVMPNASAALAIVLAVYIY